MKDLKSLKDVLHKLNYILDKRQKSFGCLIFFMSVVGAVFELFGVSAVIPLIQALVLPEAIYANRFLGPVLSALHITGFSSLVWFLCMGIVCVYILKNAYFVLLSWARAKFSQKIQRELSIKVMRSYMRRGYAFFLRTGINELTQGTSADAGGVYTIVYQGLRLIEQSATIAILASYIVATDYIMAIGVLTVSLFSLSIILVVMRSRVRRLGVENRKLGGSLTKYMLEAYGGIKDILVTNRQEFFIRRYEKQYLKMQRNGTKTVIASEIPAQLIEAVSVGGIMTAVALRVTTLDDPASYVPQLAAFALAAFRILPSLGRISSSFTAFMYAIPRLNKMYTNMQDEDTADTMNSIRTKEAVTPGVQPQVLPFCRIDIQNVSWRYENSKEDVLNEISLVVHSGESIGIIGASGAGKSTLMDVLLGLLIPQKGRILMDGRDIHAMSCAWSAYIGYVAQAVYLTDDSIRNNVAFGIDENEIDDKKVWRALKAAQLDGFIQTLPDGMDTKVGDRGVRLSGGQRQRIAIARALYHDPPILIFDEATSALDNATEAAVMEAIEALHGAKTLLIVAHRLSTVRKCDRVYEVVEGKTVERRPEELQA